MKIVVDTNILISAFNWEGNPHRIIERALQRKINLVISPQILEEFKVVALRPVFEFSEEEIDKFIESILEVCEMTIPIEKLDVIKDDPSDNKILECALEAKAGFIISGDRHLLKLKEFKGIKILTAKQFLDIL
ncbi:putative toxin-antitoxin system toxin component, PIN family [Candidatus Micrarchaeota archaeon]|nr:putative toxin-antitoxin system toxin component, PIN family [Candidatus Micrarchaeota archaeon]